MAVAVLWSARAPLLRGLATRWVISDPLSPADAVVVLGGRVDLRPLAAAEIYKRGLARKVLVADQAPRDIDARGPAVPVRDINHEVLRKLSAPDEVIVKFGNQPASTYDEARALGVWAIATGATRVIIPSDLFHTRRVKWIFERELGKWGVHVDVMPLSRRDYEVGDWWRHEKGLAAFKNELMKYIFYRLSY